MKFEVFGRKRQLVRDEPAVLKRGFLFLDREIHNKSRIIHK
jgi:hypothetical protein